VAPASTGVEDEPAPAVRQTPPAAVAAKPAAKPVVASRPPAAPAASSNLTRQAQAALVEADRQYFQGQAENALSRLKPLVDDGRVSESVRREVKTAYNNYSALYSQYVGGQAAFGRGDKEGAFQQWTAFMGKESSLFGGRKSSYTRSISTRVVDEYVSIGNEASRKGDHHSAYRNWQKALELGDSVAARIAIDSANNKAMQLYRQALRLEYVNTGKAKSLWQEVTELIPPGTEYNTKASAKLAWYDKWGA
jgi:tetratricopeptide (TPR) repeat protein